MRPRNCGYDFAFHDAQSVGHLLFRVAALLQLDNRDQLLDALVRNRYRRAAARGDLLDRRLDVVGRVVAPVDNQEVLDAADDEQLSVGEKARVAGSQPGPPGGTLRRVEKLCTESVLS